MHHAAAKTWTDPDAFGSVLLALGLDRYGVPGGPADESPVHWSKDTWIEEVRTDTMVTLPERSVDRLMAACAAVARPDQFYGSEKGFNDVAVALAGTWFDPTVWHPPTVDEALWTVIEVHLMDPPDEESSFGPQVIRYINMLCHDHGFRALPRAFQAFGVPKDPAVWARHDAVDYSPDPDVNLAVEAAASQREADLDLDTADRLRLLADQIERLPLKGDTAGTAAELRAQADRLATAGQGLIDQ